MQRDESLRSNRASPAKRSTVSDPGIEPEAFRRLGSRVIDLAADHMTGMRERPVNQPVPEDLVRSVMAQPLPDSGRDPDSILEFIEQQVLPYPMGNGHPRFYAWINTPPAPIAVLADTLATTMNPPADGGGHVGNYLLRCATRWLMELVGFPTEGSMGLLVSGGSMANLTALAVARHWAAKQDGWNLREDGLQGGRPAFVAYTSIESHSSLQKSVELLGLGTRNLRSIQVDENHRLDVAALETAIADDRAAGHRPFCVMASAGTTNTGAIDPLQQIADLCAREGLWFHVDGAYGAFGILDPEYISHFAGMERADSLALDPHKWLSVPVECGCVLVRDAALQRETFSLMPPYLRSMDATEEGELPWPIEYGFTLTSGFRALKLWATLAQLGRAGVQDMIVRHNALARRLGAGAEAAPDLELSAPVSLSIVCFRYLPRDWAGSEADLDALNQEIINTINRGGEAYIMSTALNGRTVLRACIMHYDNDEDDIDHLVALVRQIGAELETQFRAGRA